MARIRDYDRDARIITLYNAGKSYGEIADVLNLASRGVVSSIIHRARLRHDPNLARPEDRGKKWFANDRPAKMEAPRTIPPKKIRRPPLPPAPAPIVIVGGFTLMQLSARACRWPLGGEHEDTLFCGAATTDELSPYCAPHQKKSVSRVAA